VGKLEINLADLMMAFEDSGFERNYYLDLETGRVIALDAEIQGELEDLYAELDDEGVEFPCDLAQVLRGRGLSEWQQEMLLEADEIEQGYHKRYIGLPEGDSYTAYDDMEDFIFTVQDDDLRDRLFAAIRGRGAFRRFKDLLYRHPREQERRFTFEDGRTRRRVLDWFASQDIDAVLVEPTAQVDSGPPARTRLIAEVLAFVHAACKLPGVVRIALIGSLTTDEPEPKDADVLVTVTDDADLAPLATLGRKLAGHAQGFNRGGDVFLADPRGHYLGRTCPWRRCGPGIRMSCDALHCGRRPYLHDDWEAIRLDEALIAAPPIELWPEIVTRVSVPQDVEQDLIAPLKGV
jgi:hypothetical protein